MRIRLKKHVEPWLLSRYIKAVLSSDELSEIERFALFAGKGNLYEYLQLERDATEPQKLSALEAKRTWAQGQQANPKFRQEAVWLLKNQGLCQRVLTTESNSYLEHLTSKELEERGSSLLQFIQGVVAGGHLTNRGLQTIQHKAMNSGISISQMNALVQRVLEDDGASRVTGQDPNFVDYYELFKVHPTAELPEIEAAYRTQYDTYRRMSDTRKAQQSFSELDMAWDVLQDHEGRAFFDSLLSLQQAEQAPIAPDETSQSSLRGVPGGMHRSPGEQEREFVPAATDGISYAPKLASPPTTEGLPAPDSTELRPTTQPIKSKAIRFSAATPEPSPLKATRPQPSPEARAKPKQSAQKASRIPLSPKSGISPGVVVAFLILIVSAVIFYWTVMQ